MPDPAVEIQLYPNNDGSWSWRKSDAGQELRAAFGTRAEALADARKANGRSVSKIFNEAGDAVGEAVVDGALRIVMLRTDGSFYAEVDAPADYDMPKRARVSVSPAETAAVGQDVTVE